MAKPTTPLPATRREIAEDKRDLRALRRAQRRLQRQLSKLPLVWKRGDPLP